MAYLQAITSAGGHFLHAGWACGYHLYSSQVGWKQQQEFLQRVDKFAHLIHSWRQEACLLCMLLWCFVGHPGSSEKEGHFPAAKNWKARIRWVLNSLYWDKPPGAETGRLWDFWDSDWENRTGSHCHLDPLGSVPTWHCSSCPQASVGHPGSILSSCQAFSQRLSWWRLQLHCCSWWVSIGCHSMGFCYCCCCFKFFLTFLFWKTQKGQMRALPSWNASNHQDMEGYFRLSHALQQNPRWLPLICCSSGALYIALDIYCQRAVTSAVTILLSTFLSLPSPFLWADVCLLLGDTFTSFTEQSLRRHVCALTMWSDHGLQRRQPVPAATAVCPLLSCYLHSPAFQRSTGAEPLSTSKINSDPPVLVLHLQWVVRGVLPKWEGNVEGPLQMGFA